MLHKLTNLQRIGISFLLTDMLHHGAMGLRKGGTIKFVYMESSDNIEMHLFCFDGKIYTFTLEHEECIDERYIYSFQYDAMDKFFHIINIEEPEDEKVVKA